AGRRGVVGVDATIAPELLLARRLVVERHERPVLEPGQEGVRLVELVDRGGLERARLACVKAVQRLLRVGSLIEDEADDEEQRNGDGRDDEERDQTSAAAAALCRRWFGGRLLFAGFVHCSELSRRRSRSAIIASARSACSSGRSAPAICASFAA